MDFLSDWLKSVILVILLATFVDLLLPNQSMQRYVKTVISLFLLMTLLHPILSLIDNSSQIDQKLGSALFKQDAAWKWQSGNGTDRMESLPAIQQRAETLRLRREEQSQRIVQNQVADLIKRKIEQTAGVQVQSVQVDTRQDENGQAVIRSVALSLDFVPSTENTSQQSRYQAVGSSGPVRPVEPVDIAPIEIGEDRKDSNPAWASDEVQEDRLPPEALQKQTQILLMLEQDWQLSGEQIQIRMGLSSRR
ncbi:stage III sporulation protein AF [Paenibacillus naphthalenovorans]|uniref:stage III sporulation protein AF n=1 Tax=Paenibacillus naphthalenovorans TaxID=162209 RepID=UPI00088036C6|nr:stage III sporulation protein AF [Paenibacillus naphthalenovorans]SDH77472.1 stage III sporulation protein AF [Paenibacillus naphthalenovorans]